MLLSPRTFFDYPILEHAGNACLKRLCRSRRRLSSSSPAPPALTIKWNGIFYSRLLSVKCAQCYHRAASTVCAFTP